MARRRRGSRFPEYVPVSEKRARNRRAAEGLRKGKRKVMPVVIEGRSIARSWWGRSWNANLERYADYSNRIGRGRSYVRHGAVLDLQVAAGEVTALVKGSRRKPYEVSVTIEPLAEAVRDELRRASMAQLDSLSALLAGEFPEALKETFFERGSGLFPSPKEISFDCSCPDWATMCKHVAAVLYGIGNRLDSAPELLFSLRRVSMDELVEQTVDAAAEGLLSKADETAGDEALADADLSDVFGIELDGIDVVASAETAGAETAGEAAEAATTGNASRQEEAGAAPAGQDGAAAARRSRGRSARSGQRRTSGATVGKPEHGKMMGQFLEAVGGFGEVFTCAMAREKLPAWTSVQVSNTLQRAARDGAVERVRRGVYRLSS